MFDILYFFIQSSNRPYSPDNSTESVFCFFVCFFKKEDYVGATDEHHLYAEVVY